MSRRPPKRALIRRKGIACDVSVDGVEPLPRSAYGGLLPALRYRHVTHLFGDDVIVHVDDQTGKKTVQRQLVEPRRLYQFDPKGRLVCGSGYVDRIYAHLKSLGYAVDYRDITGRRPGALEPHWGRVERHGLWTPKPGDAEEVARRFAAGEPIEADLSRPVKQAEILREIARRTAKGLGGVIRVPPGVGKSYAIAAICLLLKRAKVAVLLPDQDNFHKTWRHLTRFLPQVGARGCGQRRLGPRVNVFHFASAHWMPDDVDVVLVDEGHKAAAAGVSASLATHAVDAVRWTLTATPTGRPDRADARIEGMFGPIVYDMDWPTATALGLVVPIEVRWLPGDFAANPAAGLEGVWRKKKGIWTNDDRNAQFARYARKHEAEQVLAMVATIEHALELRKFLPGFRCVYGEQDVQYFDRYRKRGLIDDDFEPVSSEARERMRRDFEDGTLRHVIATDVWSTGVSFDGLQVLLRLDARGSTILDEQIPGRVSRAHAESGKKAGILYDSEDRFDRGFRGTARGRERNYGEKGWAQRRVGARSRLAT